MNPEINILSLKVESSAIQKNAPNFCPSTWPPANDFPIVINGDGDVISRYGDQIWIFTPWAKKITSINFGDGQKITKAPNISPENSYFFRQVVAWWLYGPGKTITATAIVRRFEILRSMFVFCSKQNILVTDLSRYPRVTEGLTEELTPSSASYALTLLHDLWEQREGLGFVILDSGTLQKLADSILRHEKEQTPYIPPRIWLYQVNRLRACLDDFITHKQSIIDCFNFCLNAYAKNAGSLSDACRLNIPPTRRPFFTGYERVTGERTGAEFHGHFIDTATRFGIDELLSRWVGLPTKAGVKVLSIYFNLIKFVGTAYILNFSMMRIDEGESLRADCLSIEHDKITGEDIYILEGPTTKTIEDDDARWITSPSAAIAIEAMSCVARLRMTAAEANPDTPTTEDDVRNPFLVVRAYEPWRAKSDYIHYPLSTRPTIQSYASLAKRYSLLFDTTELCITQEDIQVARLINPTLNPEEFEVGKVWNLAWHQLRRTGAVNMSASGIVGDASVQYQLKHATRGMTRYYGQGFYHLDINLNNEARTEYIKTMYEVIAKEFSLLQSPRFVSPHGDKRKEQLLSLVSEKDHKELVKAAKAGKLAYRDHLLGGCTKVGPCPYGGVDNIARCGGGDGKPACGELLLDKTKAPKIRKLHSNISDRLKRAPEGSPLQESLQAQLRATENALNVLESD